MKKIYHILFAAAGIALPACAAQTQYKVESFNGAPFITENGKRCATALSGSREAAAKA